LKEYHFLLVGLFATVCGDSDGIRLVRRRACPIHEVTATEWQTAIVNYLLWSTLSRVHDHVDSSLFCTVLGERMVVSVGKLGRWNVESLARR
jgi:hypothetical protein